MNTQYRCQVPGRVAALRIAAQASPPRLLNGIEYLEVDPMQRRLHVHFVHGLALVPDTPLSAANVEIRGGVRVVDPQVTGIAWHDDVLSVEVASAGDFSRYLLRLVADAGTGAPPPGIDPALAQIEFSFKVDCPSDFDCAQPIDCAPEHAAAPRIDYLARDYATFRRLVLDRMSALMPTWRERNPADAWVAAAEAVAYRADEIAYFQDAVATEAYLGTARQRASIRRHTRLLDYAFHDGCNARAWVAFAVDAAADGQTLAGCDAVSGMDGCQLLTVTPGLPPGIAPAVAEEALDAGAMAFELLHPLTVFSAHNHVGFHTWSDEECCLPRGATTAYLRDTEANRLRLRIGDVLIFEALRSATTGEAADADRQQRCAVRLTHVDPQAPLVDGVRGVPFERRDPVTDLPFVEIHWSAADALPFALCLSKRIAGVLVTDMAAAAGNVAPADHGRSLRTPEPLAPVPGGRVPQFRLLGTEVAPLTRQGRVRLTGSEDAVPVDETAPAASAFAWDMADVRPCADLRGDGGHRRWSARNDLLASSADAAEYVVETDNDGRALLRFGDGINGRTPLAAERLSARLRIGNGAAGNVGAEAIGHVVVPFAGIIHVRNPMPATGGTEPHAAAQARLYAPQAFRRQERAVTEEDYGAMMQREPRVQHALATRRWTGSWYTMFITVDRRGGRALDPGFEAELQRFIERYRLAGHDVEIDEPQPVALDIALHVCTRSGYFAADVERKLYEAFGADRLASGEAAFFHPDRFTFGQPVHLSAMIAVAMQIPGVAYVTPTRFQRLGRSPAGELAAGRIGIARLEIARLDNDPNAPENGRLRFDVHPGA